MKKEINRNIIICFLIFVLAILSLFILFYKNLNRNNKTTIEGNVKYVGKGFVIVEDDNKTPYKIDTEESYSLEDKISVTFDKINENVKPIEGNTIKIDIKETIEPNKEEKTDKQEEKKEPTTEEKFKSVVDYLIYNEKIESKTFTETDNQTKITYLETFYELEKIIDEESPNYKEELTNKTNKTYSDLQPKITEIYLNTIIKICESNEEQCQKTKEQFKNIKNNYSLSWDFIKKIEKTNITKLKEWYEIWRD